ncbi:MAG: guanylate kinase [Dehalococcoidales bacterium]|nr:guanylate kinase [Dehalococcoidales bacterium]
MRKVSSEPQSPINLLSPPLLIVLSGPSGAGKDALLTKIKESGYPLCYITTVTTRAKRANETDNQHYHFTSREKFHQMMESGELLESANVYGNWYGVPRKPVKQALERGQDVILKTDVQGAATIKKILPQAVLIFLAPPSIAELTLRLRQRHTELPFDLALRLRTAEEEIRQLPYFDYIVINQPGKIDQAAAEIRAIITAARCRVNRQKISL